MILETAELYYLGRQHFPLPPPSRLLTLAAQPAGREAFLCFSLVLSLSVFQLAVVL